jgi:hypothetical protein
MESESCDAVCCSRKLDSPEIDLFNVMDAEKNSMQWHMGLTDCAVQNKIRIDSTRLGSVQLA